MVPIHCSYHRYGSFISLRESKVELEVNKFFLRSTKMKEDQTGLPQGEPTSWNCFPEVVLFDKRP